MTERKNVLVVDDNPDLLDTFSLILRSKGYNVDTAPDGVAAVNKVQLRPFDIVLMDIIMPRMNGVEAFRKIKQISPQIKTILMSAYSDDDEVRAAIDEGACCALHKPIDVRELMDIIKEAAESPVILLVDDDDDFCRTFAETLKKKGYQVVSALSGEEAINVLQKKECRVALVDLKMPLMDGVQTYLKLREINPNLAAVMMTGFREEMSYRLKGYNPTAELACLYKPFDPGQAIDLIQKLQNHTISRGRAWRNRAPYC